MYAHYRMVGTRERMSQSPSRIKSTARVLVVLAVLTMIAASLSLRVLPIHDHVLADGFVRFLGNDAWCHMRLVDNLLAHREGRIYFDPYVGFPKGQDVLVGPFFDWIIAACAWFISLGSPSERAADLVGAFTPAALGALLPIPVYLLGRHLFNPATGLFAAALIAVLPGQLLLRSRFGFADHHAAETFLSTLAVLMLVVCLRALPASPRMGDMQGSAYARLIHPFSQAILGGIVLGCYLLTWVGGALFVLCIFIWFVIQFTLDHLYGRPTAYLCLIGIPFLLVALLMVRPIAEPLWPLRYQVIALLGSVFVIIALGVLSAFFAARRTHRFYFPLAVIGLGVGILLGFRLLDPELLSSILSKLGGLKADTKGLSVFETRPLLIIDGRFTLAVAWEQFNISFFTTLTALVVLLLGVVRNPRPDRTLCLVWSTCALLATLGQNRFAYYFAVNVALLSGFCCARFLELAGSLAAWSARRKPAKPDLSASRHRGSITDHLRPRDPLGVAHAPPPRGRLLAAQGAALAIIIIAVLSPNLTPALTVAGRADGPSDDWHATLTWLRENSPEPFGDPDYYYRYYSKPPNNAVYDYPDTAYGVLSWWDYGYWIARTARRIPVALPTQTGAGEVARFLTAQGEQSAVGILDELGAKYVVLDHLLPIWQLPGRPDPVGRFGFVATWANCESQQFYETYYRREIDGRLSPVSLYYPEYFRSMCVRLYTFGGRSITPRNSTYVVAYDTATGRDGQSVKLIRALRRYPSYPAARLFVETQDDPKLRIVATNPTASCVPLESLGRFALVYQSPTTVATAPDGSTVSQVRVFQYSPD
ncbi:MAG: oligosaccharyl transferase, archaeosortase A system-associated [Phycisphaerales bacterium]|nr:MAG: oligosaccharyl transferase, archaeosortase A system-associated [Phycisphaerales bacterium]